MAPIMGTSRLKRQGCICTLARVPLAVLWISVLKMTMTTASAKTLAMIVVPSGQELFREHCAQCHGADGTGNGPMAKVLNVSPANLTAISKRANGTFPAARVVEIIRYGGNVTGHGSYVMPIWGRVFSDEGGGGKGGGAYSRRSVVELKHYLETIQKN
jgi:mono/diheme cytochrome c family protein